VFSKLNSLELLLTIYFDYRKLWKETVISTFLLSGYMYLCNDKITIFSWVRLDGSLSQKQRAKVIEEFNTDNRSCIMLASLKAGGVGLNLTKANKVVLMDCW
jgi:DNA repair protein RAD5